MNIRPRFPTKDGCDWWPQGLLWAKMCAVYGAAFTKEECGKANIWLLSNPGRMKTCRGMPRFLNGWLAKACKDARTVAQNRSTDAYMSQGAVEMPEAELAALRERIGYKPIGRIQ